MKILIVSGFLGAGKTTFIKALAKHTGKEFAILENEYGAAGIDKDRLETELASGTVNIWEMTEGCICCSAKGDFALFVLSIYACSTPCIGFSLKIFAQKSLVLHFLILNFPFVLLLML